VKKRGADGQALETEVADRLGLGRMRLVGLNATFAQTIARSGNVAFLSQSGALPTAILD
jgi:acetyltransferase